MNIKVNLMVGEYQLDHVLSIEDHKLESLSEEEIEAVIEIRIRDWANDLIRIAWEVEEE
ncbi:hypothetical protein [Paenibacillus sp. J2TS4]|uniref:hypothetical protein n=1 Tax=Paenibacillus sp. J2TS4 TaxID=2807194 RepID=UPI001B10B261|nr:hypothetical protein [Paenibacillus sp. J2TS4]GIP31180.1 hypothetical protein J2TS4_03900 [Paenibacillus sp. J2TS4]